MSDDPAIDPIEAFIWLCGGLSSDERDVRKAAEMAKRIHLAIGSDDIQILDKACREAIKGYQRRVMGTDRS